MNDGKYNYGFMINEEMVRQGDSSHAKILQQVRRGSMILECGPADGVMTRYLKEVLECSVYILELDPDCYAHAIRYADDGACVDLESDDWMSSIPTGAFDYILYADVLEHLRDPQTVLTKMKRFLKPDGRVLLSVPNVAHGDIIANLLCDQFTYTPLGLLDNTHIHLFARKNLHDMIHAAGYYLERESCTRVPLFTTEQGAFVSAEMHTVVERALILHPTSLIYQYVCCLSQNEVQTVSDVCIASESTLETLDSRFYFDFGSGLTEEHRINVYPELLGEDRLRYTVEIPAGCIAVRYDPAELWSCVLQGMVVKVDGTPISAQPLNGLTVGGSVFFPTGDPQISILPPADGHILTLETTLVLLDTGWDEVGKMMAELKSVLAQETANLEAERTGHAKAAQELENERAANRELAQKLENKCAANRELAQKLENKRAANRELAQKLENKRAANRELAQKLEAERAAYARIERQLSISQSACGSLKRDCIRAEDSAAKYSAECAALSMELSARMAELETMKNSRSWRITKPLRALKQAFTPKSR